MYRRCVTSNIQDIDWGSLDVYTCSSNCAWNADISSNDSYMSEYVWVQSPPEKVSKLPINSDLDPGSNAIGK